MDFFIFRKKALTFSIKEKKLNFISICIQVKTSIIKTLTLPQNLISIYKIYIGKKKNFYPKTNQNKKHIKQSTLYTFCSKFKMIYTILFHRFVQDQYSYNFVLGNSIREVSFPHKDKRVQNYITFWSAWQFFTK